MFIELQDGYRDDYDGLLIATGTETIHKNIPGMKDATNLLYLDNLNDHQKLQQTLETIKNIVKILLSLFLIDFDWSCLNLINNEACANVLSF